MSQRLERLREVMAREGVEGILITQPENRRYLSGFTAPGGISEGLLIITPDEALVATDFRYYEQVRMQCPDFRLVEVTEALSSILAATMAELGIRRLGFEARDLTVETFEQWKAAMPAVEWAPTSGWVEQLRLIKDADEIAAMAEAVRIADEAMAHIYEWIHPGMTEREVSWELEVWMRTHGAEALSFTTIVASGPNGAMAHAVTTDRAIQAGEPVVIDMGAVYNGYCSDLTRSFCLGRASDEYRAIWSKVLEAQQAAEQAIIAGMSGVEADAVARRIIEAANYGDKFGHGLGHGVGLAIHEGPRASRMSRDTLQPGMTLTVEPGIYLPGWGGVRIEDLAVITPEGCRVLTQAPKVPVVGAPS